MMGIGLLVYKLFVGIFLFLDFFQIISVLRNQSLKYARHHSVFLVCCKIYENMEKIRLCLKLCLYFFPLETGSH